MVVVCNPILHNTYIVKRVVTRLLQARSNYCSLDINTVKMIKSDIQRLDAKRRHVNERKKQFAVAVYKQQNYPHRLNFYELPPTSEISLEDFEKWAIHRLRSKYIHTDRLLRLTEHLSSR